MNRRTQQFQKARASTHLKSALRVVRNTSTVPHGKRNRGIGSTRSNAFLPPEDWHEPADSITDYRIVVQDPGPGYRHPITAEQIRERLSQLPTELLAPLQVVQLSRLTRKKKTFPCYGMQWGSALYLYPVEANLTERFGRPPTPAQRIEAGMYGAQWEQEHVRCWKLVWTEEALADFYLNNVLIHELGHLLDVRNRNFTDRERFAEWFAIQYGYKSRRDDNARAVVRRHDRRG